MIVSIDVAEASAVAGVVAVHTGDTIGLPAHIHNFGFDHEMARWALARDRVRHVGEAVAVVIAETAELAEDAAELVLIDLEPLDPVIGGSASEQASFLYPNAGTNVVLDIPDDSPDPLAKAAVIVDVEIVNHRVASAPIETDGVIVTPSGDSIDVWATTQGVHGFKSELLTILGLEADQVRVRAPAVGGGFGGRVMLPVEFAVVARVALDLQQPVRWHQSRYENLTGMPQGRDLSSRLRLGLTEDGTIVGLDVDVLADVGATAHGGAGLLVSVRRQAAGLYRIPHFRWSGKGVLTNTTPVGAYRGAGQPEANHARERAIDIAAHRLGIDPLELRRNNLYEREEFPLTAAGGVTYDSADPAAALDLAVRLIDMDHWREEQALRRVAGDQNSIGVGVSCYSQTSGRGSPIDAALVQVLDSGRVSISCGSPSHGQGHRTTWANLVSTKLGVDPTHVDVVDSDTAAISTGLSTGGSRASQVLASALVMACDDLIHAAKPIAARHLEAAEEDLVVVDVGQTGTAGLSVRGVPSSVVGWAEIARGAENGCLEAMRDGDSFGEAHPYGAHASVVEVDTSSGFVTLLAHVAVDDCGVVLEPEIVLGQQHGGSVAGLAQVLWEYMSWDDQGTPETALFTNYGLPSAAELPSITASTMNTVSARNPLGSRGIGENGCNGAPAAVHNAVIDAVSHLGVEHIDMPLTPQRVWRAIAGGR